MATALSLIENLDDKRGVFYELLGEYSPRYLALDLSKPTDIDSEVRAHLDQIRLLLLFFDFVLIQTASVFNNRNPFIRSVVQVLFSHREFRCLMRHGAIKICGWGDRDAQGMFGSALEYASQISDIASSGNYISTLERTFDRYGAVYRSDTKPDQEQTDTFRQRIGATPLITDPTVIRSIESAIDFSHSTLGGLSGLALRQKLEIEIGDRTIEQMIFDNYYRSWIMHLNATIPKAYFFVDPGNEAMHDLRISVDEKRIHAFLLSPVVFRAFIMRFLTHRQFIHLMKIPVTVLMVLRNGDWKRFTNSYHEAIVKTSELFDEIDTRSLFPDSYIDPKIWAERLAVSANNASSGADPHAFLSAMASLSGLLIGLPGMAAGARLLSATVGRTIDKIYSHFFREWGHEMSPFIRKVKQHAA